jgi:uncharacterized protein (DUF433 family)
MNLSNVELVGVGLYGVPEAARLSNVSAGRIRRWLKGYVYHHADEDRVSPAVWEPQLPILEGTVGLSFLDLMEVRFVDAFLQAGVSWRTIRLAAQRAREILDLDHPFSTRRFQTDGHSIFAEVLRESGEHQLLDLAKNQYAFRRVISPSLYSGMDFDLMDRAARWWPMGKGRGVVVDPSRQFGQPIVSEGSIPTAVLADAVKAEGSVSAAARWYDVPEAMIRDAVAFERQLAA